MDIIFVNDSICTGSSLPSSAPARAQIASSNDVELTVFLSSLLQFLATLKSDSGLDQLQKSNLRWTDEED